MSDDRLKDEARFEVRVLSKCLRDALVWVEYHGHDWEYFPDWVQEAKRLLGENK